jgi:hypothetical protein
MFDRLIAADLTRLVHTYNTFCEKFAQVLVWGFDLQATSRLEGVLFRNMVFKILESSRYYERPREYRMTRILMRMRAWLGTSRVPLCSLLVYIHFTYYFLALHLVLERDRPILRIGNILDFTWSEDG